MLYIALQLVLLVIGISIVTRVWRASALDGVLCLIVPFYVLLPMVKHWKDPDFDIRWHVLLLFVCAGAVVWAQFHWAHQVLGDSAHTMTKEERAQALAEAIVGQAGSDDDDEGDLDDEQARLARYQERVEFGRKAHPPAGTVPAGKPSAPVSHEPDTPVNAAAVTEQKPMTPRQALAAAVYRRGAVERATLGFSIDLPGNFHALTAGDIRRIELSRNQTPDAREIAWAMHESMALDAPGAWFVRVRWLSDGWVSAAGSLDGWRLLQQAQRAPASAHLAGSGGDLIGYAIAPAFSGSVADWVEERLPAGANASVLDCHALRLGRAGVLEFSVIGAPAGSQVLCDLSVRLLARSTRFDSGADYSPAAIDARRAPYSLAELISAAR